MTSKFKDLFMSFRFIDSKIDPNVIILKIF